MSTADGGKAVVVTHSWRTGETLHTPFDGPDAGIHATLFLEAEKARGDFPAPEWVWFMYVAPGVALDNLAKWRVSPLLGKTDDGQTS